MNKEKPEPAKIIGKVELKKDDAGTAPENDLGMEEKGTEGGDKVDSGTPETSVTPEPGASAQTKGATTSPPKGSWPNLRARA